MNYRHIFHAGNFGDVFKHWILTLLLRSLHRKETPFFYMETHAGAGRYDLMSQPARKTGEHRDGVERLWRVVVSAEFENYLAAVRAVNTDLGSNYGALPSLRTYPGSPLIAVGLARAQDRLVLFECEAHAHAALQAEFARDRRVAVHHADGYTGLKSALPPHEGRGLVLIDPAYEHPDGFTRVLAGLQAGYDRWGNGIYAVWYPIKDRAANQNWRGDIAALGLRKTLIAELAVFPEDNAFRLNACGMIIVNPPWQIDRVLELGLAQLLSWLQRDVPGRCEVTWLVPE